MSNNYCLTGVAATLRLGIGNAQLTGNSSTEIGVRNSLNTLDANLLIADPIAAQHAATKAYVDQLVNGLAWKQYVRVCTTVALAANTRTANTLTADANGDLNLVGIDGITDLVVGDAVLVQTEVLAIGNGIYEVTDLGSAGTPWVLGRRSDALDGDDATSNATFCAEGTAGADKAFVQTADAAIYGTTALVYAEFASISAGVTSVVSETVPANGVSLVATPGTGAVTITAIGQTTTINPTSAAGVVSLDVRPASITATEVAGGAIGTVQLQGASVQDVQRAELAGVIVRTGVFTIAGVTAPFVQPLLGPGALQDLETNKTYLVLRSQVFVTTSYDLAGDQTAAKATVEMVNDTLDPTPGTAIFDPGDIDLFVEDSYLCDNNQLMVANVTSPWKFQVSVVSATATAGTARAIVLAVKLD